MTHHRIAASLDHKFGAGALHVTQVGRVEGEVPRLQVVRIKAIQRRREALASEGEVVHLNWVTFRMSEGVLMPPLIRTTTPRTSSEAILAKLSIILSDLSAW